METAAKLPDSVLRQKQVYTTGQVARMLGVNPRTVAKWADSGRLKCYCVPPGRDRRILRWELVRFLKDNDMPLAWELCSPVVYWLGRPALDVEGAESVKVARVWDLAVQTAMKPAAVAVIDVGDVGRWAAKEAVEGLARSPYKPSIIAVMTEDDADCVAWHNLGVTACVPSPGLGLSAIVSKLIGEEK